MRTIVFAVQAEPARSNGDDGRGRPLAGGWEHTVKIERIADAVPGLPYPVLLDATGRCPPKDVGSPWGYSELLEVLADPDHERHDELMEWVGDPFNPLTSDVDQLAKSVDALARKWTRKPPPPRKTR